MFCSTAPLAMYRVQGTIPSPNQSKKMHHVLELLDHGDRGTVPRRDSSILRLHRANFMTHMLVEPTISVGSKTLDQSLLIVDSSGLYCSELFEPASKVKKIRGITTAAKACCGKTVALVIEDRTLQRKPRRANGCLRVIRLISLEEKSRGEVPLFRLATKHVWKLRNSSLLRARTYFLWCRTWRNQLLLIT